MNMREFIAERMNKNAEEGKEYLAKAQELLAIAECLDDVKDQYCDLIDKASVCLSKCEEDYEILMNL